MAGLWVRLRVSCISLSRDLLPPQSCHMFSTLGSDDLSSWRNAWAGEQVRIFVGAKLFGRTTKASSSACSAVPAASLTKWKCLSASRGGKTCGYIICGTAPNALLDELLAYFRSVHFARPSRFG